MSQFLQNVVRLTGFLSVFVFVVDASTRFPGQLCAFVDVNGDQYTDIITINPDNRESFFVYEASMQDLGFAQKGPVKITKAGTDEEIINCAVGDFDGDSYPDLLVSLSDKSSSEGEESDFIKNACICFGGEKTRFSCSFCHPFELSTAGQPTVLDFSFHYRSDFYVPLKNGSSLCFSYENRTLFTVTSCFSSSTSPPVVPNFVHSYADLNNDYNPEFIQATRSTNDYPVNFTVWHYTASGSWTQKESFLPPLNVRRAESQLLKTGSPFAVGYPIVGDFDGDGSTDLLVPVCQNSDCSDLAILAWNQWTKRSPRPYWANLKLHLNDSEGTTWGLVGSTTDSTEGTKVKILKSRIRVGDFSLDGYPDLLLLLESTGTSTQSEKERSVFLAENVACSSVESCDGWTRRFQVKWSFPFVSDTSGSKITRAAFFDLAEDGNLDIVLEYSNQGKSQFSFLKSEDKGDTSFVKAEVFTGTCGGTNCPNEYRIGGSGVSAPGGTISFLVLDGDGHQLKGRHVQLSQSSYRSLELPYALFGMGRTPNFVEKLTVGIPQNKSVFKSWEQIVPNARLYVIPYRPSEPREWKSKLYLTPSRLILLSFAALCCVCGVNLILIVLLHWREKRQDKLEKQQQAHKFNFDAM